MDKRKRNRNLAALGLLTIAAVGLFFWGLYYLLGNPVLKGGMDVVVALENGAGLKRGDRVHLQGVEVGSVRSVVLSGGQGVHVDVRLRDSFELPADTRAAVTGDVFGAHTLELLPGTARVRLEDRDTISGAAAAALPELAADVGARAASALSAVDALLSEQAVADIHATTAVLPASAAELRAAFGELRLAAAALRRTAENVESAQTGEAVNSAVAEVEQSARALTSAAETMQRSLGSLASVMEKIDGGQGTFGLLVNDSSLYMELSNTLREMRALAADIRERPGRYINLRVF